MWEITDADRHRWQAAAITRLTGLVRTATEMGYPALTWTVGRTGGLVGYVTGPDHERRLAFEVWAAAIAATRRDERSTPSGTTELYADREHLGLVEVAITATLFPRDDEIGSDAK